jgi:hypothetical protein
MIGIWFHQSVHYALILGENHIHFDVLLCWIQQRVPNQCNHDPSQLLADDGATQTYTLSICCQKYIIARGASFCMVHERDWTMEDASREMHC